MTYQIKDSYENERGCGFRKAGGLYMVAGSEARSCGKLPIELTVCPCCSEGIKQHRGISVVSSQLLEQSKCNRPACVVESHRTDGGCHPFGKLKKFFLMWVGEKYYPTSEYFTRESREQGVSKRITAVPKDFTVGKDWILLAHPKTLFTTENGAEFKKGIFSAFCPERIEYVVKGDESDAELQAKADRGITLVRVHKAESNHTPTSMFSV